MLRPRVFPVLFALALLCENGWSQEKLYTARGYWEEVTHTNYRLIKAKQDRGDSLTVQEAHYVKDYELFLRSYFERMPQDEKEDYARLKPHWDGEAEKAQWKPEQEDFELRTRDRLTNGLYGLYYGLVVVSVGEIESPASVGIPLITSGVWTLGPAINVKKYKDVRLSTIRAGNTGRLLGLIYGAGLGLAVGGQMDESGKWALGTSAAGSIALGEIAFQAQRKKNYSNGHIEMMRHYGILGPAVATAGVFASGTDNTNMYGIGILGGGIGGLLIGSHVAKKYDYTRGDVDAISSLSLIATGIGFTAIAEYIEDSEDTQSLILVPALAAVAATVLEQRAVHGGVQLTDKQGSTISLASGGAALVGLGFAAIGETESPAVLIGLPSGMALITHQILFSRYKRQNLELKLRGGLDRKNFFSHLSLKVTPESYLLNQSLPVKNVSPQRYANLQNPVFRLTFRF